MTQRTATPSGGRAKLRNVRRLLPVLAGVVIVAAGLFGLLLLFNGRDSGEVSTEAAQGPGVLEQEPGDPPTSGEPGTDNLQREGDVEDAALLQALSLGNVALVYGSGQPPPELEQLREETIGGSFDPELAAAGQMVVLVRRENVDGVQALAWKRRLEAQSPADPQLRQFVEAWLGRGRGNTE